MILIFWFRSYSTINVRHCHTFSVMFKRLMFASVIFLVMHKFFGLVVFIWSCWIGQMIIPRSSHNKGKKLSFDNFFPAFDCHRVCIARTLSISRLQYTQNTESPPNPTAQKKDLNTMMQAKIDVSKLNKLEGNVWCKFITNVTESWGRMNRTISVLSFALRFIG